jgi:hypothetical protein
MNPNEGGDADQARARRRAFNEVRLSNKESDRRLTATVVLACVLAAVACSCSSQAGSTRVEANEALQEASSNSAGATAPLAGNSAIRDAASSAPLDFTLVNFTRFNLYAIYVSPHDSTGWEENVLGRDQLFDGDFVKIRFSPEEKADIWDLRVEDENGNNAEWKNLNLREISKITLRTGENAVLAEAE